MAMRIDVLTLFPEMFSIFNHSIIGKAIEKEILKNKHCKYKGLYNR